VPYEAGAPLSPDDLYLVQEELLAAAVASLDHIPEVFPELLGAPERQLVAPPGDIVAACDQVLVNESGVGSMATRPQSPAAAAGKKHVFGRVTEATLQVAVTRCCLPVGTTSGRIYTPPSAAQEQEAARQLLADGWALWNGLFTRMVRGDLLDRCSSIGWEGMSPIGPLGACGGHLLTLRVALAGYMEELGS